MCMHYPFCPSKMCSDFEVIFGMLVDFNGKRMKTLGFLCDFLRPFHCGGLPQSYSHGKPLKPGRRVASFHQSEQADNRNRENATLVYIPMVY